MEVSNAVARVDRAAGEALERAVEGHHRRRLRKAGWQRILQPGAHGLRPSGDTRERLWAEHLDLPLTGVSGHPAAVIDELWKPWAEEQYLRRAAGEPMTHRLAKLPHVSQRFECLPGPLQNLLLDG
jgi:hypothetical protein